MRGDTSWRLLNSSCTLLLAILDLSEFLEWSSYVCFLSRAGAVRLENRDLQEPWVFRYDFNCTWNNHCSTSSYMKTVVVQRRSSLKEVIVAMILWGNLEKFRSLLTDNQTYFLSVSFGADSDNSDSIRVLWNIRNFSRSNDFRVLFRVLTRETREKSECNYLAVELMTFREVS